MPGELPGMDIQRTAPVNGMTLRILLEAKKKPQYTDVVQGGVEICVKEHYPPHVQFQWPETVYKIRLTMPWEIAWLMASSLYQRPWDPKDIIREILPFVTYEYTENGRRDVWKGAGWYRTPEDLAAHAVFLIECDLQNGWGKYYEPHYRQWLVCRAVSSPLKRISDDPEADFEPIL